MKTKLIKILKLFSVLVIILFCFYQFLLSDFNNLYQNEKFILLKKSIEISKKENFKDFVDIYNKTHKIVSYKKSFLNGHNRKNGNSPFREVVNFRLYEYDSQIEAKFKNTLYALKLEESYNSDECLNYLFSNYDYLYGNKGIKDASLYFFKKNIANLNLKEKITLVVMLENPSLYNPIRERKILRNKIIEYEKIINKHKNNG